MKIMANGISMNYELVGSGKCLTLIHGSGDNLNAWYNQVPVFSQHYRVMTYDVRGHGQTELPEGELTAGLWVNDLYAILKALKISETFLLGHSMGGAIALQFTLTHPEIVKALVLSSSGGAARPSKEDLRYMEARRQVQIETIKKEGMETVIKDRFSLIFSPGFAEKNPETVEQYKSVFLQNKPERYLRVMQRMGRFSISSDPSKITCPTLVIGGEYDFGGSAAAKAAQDAIRGSQLKVFPTGHAPAIEVPQEYNETVLTFLAGVPD
jgi:pimeloyl-ACP methyl ester carboxylesterase